MNETQQFRRLLNSAVAVPIVIMALLAIILCGQILQMLRAADTGGSYGYRYCDRQ